MGEELSTQVPILSDAEGNDVNRFSGQSKIFNPIGFPALGRRICSSWFLMPFLVWLQVCQVMIFCVYGPQNVWMGPNSSVLVDPSPFFVQSVKVMELNDSKPGLEIFEFHKCPPLDVFVNWSESRSLSISHGSFKGWPYYLNNGSSLNISYSVKPEGSSALFVVEGHRDFFRPLFVVPKYLKTALSGSGVIELNITEASSYYVNVSNLNMRDVKVELDIDVRAVLYDTKQSFSKCNFSDNDCTISAMSLHGNSFVLTSPKPIEGASGEGWYIKFSYQPRWIGYLIAGVLVMCFMLVVLRFCYMLERCVTKYDDGSSVDSSYQSMDDTDLEGQICAICFGAPRDCFFMILKKMKRMFTV